MIQDVYPFAHTIAQPLVLSEGSWLFGHPIGATIHHTADRDLARVLSDAAQTKIGYHLIIDRDGYVVQTAYLGKPVSHAGEAMWNGHSPNRNHVAIAILGWGAVQGIPPDFASWSGAPVASGDVVQRCGNLSQDLQYWDAATPEQEQTLFSVLRWLLANGIDPKSVCGHDECALPLGRKDDPGGTLSMTMEAVRQKLSNPA